MSLDNIMGQVPLTKRVYVDNSVVSGMFDDHMPERVEQTGRFWQLVIDGKIRIIASDVLEGENKRAPQRAQDFFDDLPKTQIEQVGSTKESNDLALQYAGANVITDNHMNDYRHIAIATIPTLTLLSVGTAKTWLIQTEYQSTTRLAKNRVIRKLKS